jgi:hypothetical protein
MEIINQLKYVRIKILVTLILFPLFGIARGDNNVYELINGSDEIIKKIGLSESIFCMVNINSDWGIRDSVITLKINVSGNRVLNDGIKQFGGTIAYDVDFYNWEVHSLPIFNADVEIYDCLFQKNATLCGKYNKRCSFSNSKFNGKLFLQDSYFSAGFNGNIETWGEANFSNITFGSIPGISSNFSSSKFYGYTRFSNSTFNGNANLSQCLFKGGSNFSNAVFDSNSNFSSTIFDSVTIFTNTQFTLFADFKNCSFGDTLLMDSASFNMDARFNKNKFHRHLDFDDGSFSGKIDFSECSFDSVSFDLNQILISGKVSFYNSSPPLILNFRNASISGLIDLSQLNTDSTSYKGKINLSGSDIENIKFIYGALDLDMDSNISTSLRSSIYSAVLANQNKFGFLEGRKKIDIELRELKYEIEGHPIQNFIQRWWFNYGYDRGYIKYWIFGLLFIFSLINRRRVEDLNQKVYKVRLLTYIWPKSTFYKSFIYTSVIFFGLKLDIDKFKSFSKAAFWILVIHVLGLVTMAYLLGWLIDR